MTFELSACFDYLTGGIIKSRFFNNPIWMALMITIIIMIIISLSTSSLWWMRSVYIFTGTLFVLFIYNSAMLKQQQTTEKMAGAAELIGDLSYANNLDGVDVNPVIYDSNY